MPLASWRVSALQRKSPFASIDPTDEGTRMRRRGDNLSRGGRCFVAFPGASADCLIEKGVASVAPAATCRRMILSADAS